MKFLLVKDDIKTAELIKDALSEFCEDCTIECEQDLDQVLSRQELTDYAAVFADLSLPDAEGLATIRQLQERLPAIPIIVLTSLEEESIALAALEHGAQDILAKHEILTSDSLGADKLCRSLKYAIQRQKSHQEVQILVAELRNNKRLLESKNLRLEQLCDSSQRFVDNVSHEFRTPLTVIKEFSSLIRDGVVGTVNEEQISMLNVIDDRTDDLNTMVDDLLDISRLEAGLLGLCRQERNINEIVEYLLPGLRRKALVRNVRLDIDIPCDIPAVWCDGDKIGRVIINLVVNAIKFCGQPGVVRLWAVHDDIHREVIVGVRDNGGGIPENKLEDIFNRFEQSVTCVRQSTKGFGLGLSIAKELVDLNLGRMKVESELGSGSTFTFTIPYAEQDNILKRQFARLRLESPDSIEICLVSLVAQSPCDSRDLRDLGFLFQHVLRCHDQLFRIGEHQWLAVLAMSRLEFSSYEKRMEDDHREISRNRPKGNLPNFRIVCNGSWQLAECNDGEVLTAVRNCFEEREVAHV